MSKDLNDLAHDLMEETLVEAAGTFFGTRKRLEDDIDLFKRKIETLAAMQSRVLARAGDLHHLLLEGEAAADFYAALDIDPSSFIDAVSLSRRSGARFKAMALTVHGKYAKAVKRAYQRFYEGVDVFMHGKYATDEHGRKHLTPHYNQIMKQCHDLNERIQKVNSEISPSETLAFVKKLDVIEMEKSKFTGGGSGYENGLDEDLAFKTLDCEQSGLMEFPDLPGPDKAESEIARFCKSLAREHGDRVKALLKSL